MELATKKIVDEIVVQALWRVSAVLNPSLSLRSDLRLRDEWVQTKAKSTLYFAYHRIAKDRNTSQKTALKKYFYPRLSVEPSNTDKTKVAYYPTETFLTSFYEGFRQPPYSLEELGFDHLGEAEKKIMLSSYLVKNIWHMFVHNELQNISFSTSKKLKGRPRVVTEHFADNIAMILLARSYGFSIRSFSEEALRRDSSHLIRMFSRSKCSRVFAERAKYKGAKGSLKTRTLRTILNYVSGWLIVADLTPVDLYIDYNEEGVVFRVNRVWIPTKVKIDFGNDRPEYRRQISELVATYVEVEYRSRLRESMFTKMLAKRELSVILDLAKYYSLPMSA